MTRISQDKKITFFMPVIERGVCLADYCIRSYSKIRNISFTLIVYLNCVGDSIKRKYVHKWRRMGYVEIIESDYKKSMLAHGAILDIELKKIKSPYIATVDYDFEIIDAKFINYMLERMDNMDKLAAMSVGCTSGGGAVYRKGKHIMSARWHPYFCIYKQKALELVSSFSHSPRRIPIPGKDYSLFYDVSARIQEALVKTHGLRIEALSRSENKFSFCYIHYLSIGWRKEYIIESNIRAYRWLRILSQNGFLGRGKIIKKIANILLISFFGR